MITHAWKQPPLAFLFLASWVLVLSRELVGCIDRALYISIAGA